MNQPIDTKQFNFLSIFLHSDWLIYKSKNKLQKQMSHRELSLVGVLTGKQKWIIRTFLLTLIGERRMWKFFAIFLGEVKYFYETKLSFAKIKSTFPSFSSQEKLSVLPAKLTAVAIIFLNNIFRVRKLWCDLCSFHYSMRIFGISTLTKFSTYVRKQHH